MKQYIFNSTNKSLDEAIRLFLSGLLVAKQSSHEDYYEVFFKDKLSDGYVDQYISNMGVLQDASQSNKTVLCLKEAYDAYVGGTIDTISFTVIENVLFTQNADKTYFMGFDLKNSEMVKLYEKIYGVQFTDITSSQDLKYQNDIHIYYLSDKNIGNSKLMSNEEYQSIIINSCKNTLICDFNFTGYDAKKYNFENVDLVKSNRLNKDDWAMKTNVVIFSNIKHKTKEMRFLSEMGFSKEDINRSIGGNILVQIMAKSVIRKQGNTLTNNLFLIDEQSAEIVKDMLGESNVTLHKVDPS